MDSEPLCPPSKRPPARVQRILKFLKLRKAGVCVAEPPWQTYKLQNTEFDELQRWLKQDEDLWGFVEDKVRYDYDSEKESLVSRRPTVLHNSFLGLVVQEITKRLGDIATNGDLASRNFAQKVYGAGSARIDLLGTEEMEGKPKMRRDPDYSFQHCEARWAGVVLEVSCPLKRRAVPHLADDYLLETNGEIRMLVGIDLDSDTKRGTISTWQPNFKRNAKGVIFELEAALVRDSEMFRDKYGNANPDPESGLHLDLEDFGPPDLTIDLMSEVPIFIDSATLCLLLARAEAHQLNCDEGRGGAPYKPKGMRIRKRRRVEIESDCEVPGQEESEYGNDVMEGRATEDENEASRDQGMENTSATSAIGSIEGGEAGLEAAIPLRAPVTEREGSQDTA